MLEKITLVLELVSAIICIHCVYGRKVKLDISTILLFMTLLICLDVANQFHFQSVSSVILYGVIGIYCKRKFKGSLIHTIINVALFLIVLVIMQFGFVLLVNLVLPEQEMMRALMVNVCTLFCSVFILPRLHLEALSAFVRKYRIYWITGIVLFVVVLILFQDKVNNGIHTEYFVVAVPVLVMLLIMVIKWGRAQTDREVVAQELALSAQEAKHYDQLLEELRVKQHAFKNHVLAIFSARYAYETYDRAVSEQDAYYQQVIEDYRYQKLLLLENRPLIGYLYGKFREIEDDKIRVEFRIAASAEHLGIPGHVLVEMLGILLDNAVEAVKKTTPEQCVFVSIDGAGAREECCVTVANKHPYVPYDEIERWFELGQSTKGKQRGIGLYHLRTLCSEWNCDIAYRNREEDGENRIEFILRIPKKEEQADE